MRPPATHATSGRAYPHALARDVAVKIWRRDATQSRQGWQWVRRNPQRTLWVAGGTVAVALLILLIADWKPYRKHHQAFAPILTLAAGLAVAGVTLMRHFAQTEADRQRRITESFSKAIEQLGDDKLEVRLGGIYALERISRESLQDHWTVMENLTAFVREGARRTERRIAECAYLLWENAGRPEGRSEEFWEKAVEQETHGSQPPPDVAAVLEVIKRRSEDRRALETRDKRAFDFREAILRDANLRDAHLEGADFREARLERAILCGAHFERAILRGAHLERANLIEAYLERADLSGAYLADADLNEAHLERANLSRAHLEGADLSFARLERANLSRAYLEGAELQGAELQGANLSAAYLEGVRSLENAHSDARTRLPAGYPRPANWPPEAPEPDAPA